MKKTAIYFVEFSDGKRYYKTDTFWSKHSDPKNAKIHDNSSDDQERFFTSLCGGFKPFGTKEHTDEDLNGWVRKYEGSVYGYQTVGGQIVGWEISDENRLDPPTYLKIIDSIDRTGKVEWSDVKVMLRNKKINQIFDEKD